MRGSPKGETRTIPFSPPGNPSLAFAGTPSNRFPHELVEVARRRVYAVRPEQRRASCRRRISSCLRAGTGRSDGEGESPIDLPAALGDAQPAARSVEPLGHRAIGVRRRAVSRPRPARARPMKKLLVALVVSAFAFGSVAAVVGRSRASFRRATRKRSRDEDCCIATERLGRARRGQRQKSTKGRTARQSGRRSPAGGPVWPAPR